MVAENPEEDADDSVVSVSDIPHRNEVVLVGLVSAEAHSRVSRGVVVTYWRVAVRRPDRGRRGQLVVDALHCVTFEASIGAAAVRWRRGDLVEVHGAVHRRFWRTDGGVTSRYEIVVREGWLLAVADRPWSTKSHRTTDPPATSDPTTAGHPATSHQQHR